MKIQPVIVTLLIWFGGMAVSFIRLLFRYFRVAKKVRAGAMCKDVRCEKFLKMEIDTTCMKAEKTGNKRKSKIQILNSESIDTPMSFGLFHKMILLPQKGYSYSELYHILSHEYTHFINKDLNRKLFLQILCCIFWWLPPIYAFRKIMEQAMEIKCDADVTEAMSDSEKAVRSEVRHEEIRTGIDYADDTIALPFENYAYIYADCSGFLCPAFQGYGLCSYDT